MSNETDAAEIWANQQDMYVGFETSNRARTDQYIHADCTIWDSGNWSMVIGLDGLNAIRAARPADDDQPKVLSLTAHDPVTDVWGDIAVLRHYATVVFEGDTPDELLRNTGVWQREPEGWRLIHNQEQRSWE
ncbi:nuclear transport factor 2 family protein [Salinibacterium sp. UTAS2018]|uniref:nuclear transport factor 2 family protein n=1 Tax=unclassified Salinibacterium TaxID=2632331 RepID=UPI00100974B9|nr:MULTISPECIES: nuclear transport factor 2 family protein [unclassified Salinibacterium]MBH0007866.1 nuclear transport factor 2 family protein [Salinibacterium sp. SWN1162]QAV70788.1 nuclear transport factor 2 family protein [Salinibacterium sp. UTAS2018]